MSYGSIGTISAQPVPQQEDFREVKIKDLKGYVFQFGWHFMAVYLDYVGHASCAILVHDISFGGQEVSTRQLFYNVTPNRNIARCYAMGRLFGRV
jgi:hypothetical protein